VKRKSQARFLGGKEPKRALTYPVPETIKKTKLILGVLSGLVIAAVIAWQIMSYVWNRQHDQWMERSVQELRALSTETNWIAGKIESLCAFPNQQDDLGRHFISPDLILMANGEWIVYRAATHKQGTQFPELFVGYASDGRWYYSTYHFCRQMMVLGCDGKPSSLSEFRTKYCLVPYSEEPYHELKATWPQNSPEKDQQKNPELSPAAVAPDEA